MAGYDFTVRCAGSDTTLSRALLKKTQRICRSYQLELHYKHEPQDKQFYVTVDGPLKMMQASTAVLARVLPAFAEGASRPQNRRSNVRLAIRMVKAYWKGVVRISESIAAACGRYDGIPNSLFFDASRHSEQIDDRLWSLTESIIAFENGDLGAPQILEEIHTGMEWLMKELIGSSAKRLSYAEMAQKLRDEGKLSPELCDVIIEMKDLRVGAKHRGQHVSRENVYAALEPSIEAIHRLVR